MSATRDARPAALVLTPRVPWPLDDGGRIVLWQSLWSAAQAYDVVLVAFSAPDAVDAPVPDDVRALCRAVIRVPHRPPGALAAAVRGSFGRLPHTMARFHDPAFAAAVRAATDEHRPALAIVNHLHMASYADAFAPTPWALREHNVEHSWMERFAASRRNPLVRLYARLQAGRLRRFERDVVARADLVLAMQEHEAALLRGLVPAARVEVAPVGIDFARFLPPAPATPPVVLVVGSFAYAPNAEGLRRFVAAGWPALRRLAPQARLRVAGRGLGDAFARQLAGAGVEVAGAVPDMAPEFAAASVVLVPVWYGAGARVKIVEAAAAGVPVVSTPLGAEGLGFAPGDEIVLADDPADLAAGVAADLADPVAARARAARAQARARAAFALPAVAAQTNRWCRAIERRGAA